MAQMLLDDFVPFYDVGERHDILVQAPLEKVFSTFREVDLAGSRLIKLLMGIRGLPSRLVFKENAFNKMNFNIEDMIQKNFFLLAEAPPKEIVLGSVGCFWKPVPSFVKVAPESFASFNEPGYGKIGWNIMVEEEGSGLARVSTQTRVHCLGPTALARFLPYWMIIRSFSGLIRQKMLEGIKQLAETRKEPNP